MTEQPNYYAVIPAEVRYNPNINSNVKLLYGEISALSNKYGYCIATNDYFSELYSVSTRTITDWIKALEDMTYVTSKIETKRYDDGTIKKIRKLYLNHIEDSLQNHIEVSPQNHIEENFSYNNTSNINNTSKKEIYKERKFEKPTLEEVEEYCKNRNSNVDAKTFYDYFEVGGWVDSKGNKVKNWKQKIITWERNTAAKEEKTPEWFDKEQKSEKPSTQEQDEMEEILNDIQYDL